MANYIEATEQQLTVCWFRSQYPRYAQLLIHIPNGQNTNPKTGARMKAMGLTPGVPDLVLLVSRKNRHALFIEMKAPNGKLTSSQRDWMDLVEEQNYQADVAYGFDEAREIIEEYLG